MSERLTNSEEKQVAEPNDQQLEIVFEEAAAEPRMIDGINQSHDPKYGTVFTAETGEDYGHGELSLPVIVEGPH